VSKGDEEKYLSPSSFEYNYYFEIQIIVVKGGGRRRRPEDSTVIANGL
jgi:hypothetical protein